MSSVIYYFVIFIGIIIFHLAVATSNRSCDATINEVVGPDAMVTNLNRLPDPNEKSTGPQKYNFEFSESSKYFKVERETGWLRTSRPLDRETLCQKVETCHCHSDECYLDFTVLKKVVYLDPNAASKASRPPYPMGHRICITDANDSPPQLPSSIDIEVPEDKPIGGRIDLPEAKDADSPRNSVQSYTLDCPPLGSHSDQSKIFKLHYETNRTAGKGDSSVWLTLEQPLDREKKIIYQCDVTASDGPHSTKMLVTIKVVDVNDNRPQWEFKKKSNGVIQNGFNVTLIEDSQLYSTIFTLKATDKDSKYGVLKYAIESPIDPEISKRFTINPTSGEVKLIHKLDYEKKEDRLFKIPVVVYDNGQPTRHSATSTLTVEVRDKNDNNPVIKLKKRNLKIIENTPPGYLTYFTVSDLDSGANGKVTCKLRSGTNLQFKLTSMERGMYALYSLVSFNHEENSNIFLQVICKDEASDHSQRKESKRDIIVTIVDVNDSPPRFLKRHWLANITEGIPIGTSLLKAEARDADSNPNLKYYVDRSAQSIVNIGQNSGQLFSVKEFDREEKPSVNYTFEITVTDGKKNHTDVTVVTLNILDVNDNPPTFEQTYRFSVPENAMMNYVVGQVHAVDPDNGENGTVHYSAAPHQNTPFYVHRSGRIDLIRKLDRETTEHYELKIVARDRGRSTQLSTTTAVIIEVTDVNDSPPYFPHNSYVRNVSCSNPQFVAIDIQAKDKDDPPHDQIRYSLLHIYPNRDGGPKFSVESETGEIMVADPPESKKCSSLMVGKWQLQIGAHDPTKPEAKTSTRVTVNILPDTRTGLHRGGGTGLNGRGRTGSRGGRRGNPGTATDFNLFVVVALVCFSVVLTVLILTLIVYLKKRQEERDRGYEHGTPMSKKADSCSQIPPPNSCPLPRKQLEQLYTDVLMAEGQTHLLSHPLGKNCCETSDENRLRLLDVDGQQYQHLQQQYQISQTLGGSGINSSSADDILNSQQLKSCRNESTWNPKLDTINAWVSLEEGSSIRKPAANSVDEDDNEPYHTYQTMPPEENDQNRPLQSYSNFPPGTQLTSQCQSQDNSYSERDMRGVKMSTLSNSGVTSQNSLTLSDTRRDPKKPYFTISFV